jgi:hypothetical protein
MIITNENTHRTESRRKKEKIKRIKIKQKMTTSSVLSIPSPDFYGFYSFSGKYMSNPDSIAEEILMEKIISNYIKMEILTQLKTLSSNHGGFLEPSIVLEKMKYIHLEPTTVHNGIRNASDSDSASSKVSSSSIGCARALH